MPDIATGLVAHFNTLAQNVATITRPYDATDRSPHQTLFVTQRARPFVPGPDDPIQPNITVVETRHGPMPCNTSVTDIAPSPVNLNVLSKLLFQYNKSEAAFKLIPIRHQDFPLLGFYFRDSFYFDKTLPFGCSISPTTLNGSRRF